MNSVDASTLSTVDVEGLSKGFFLVLVLVELPLHFRYHQFFWVFLVAFRIHFQSQSQCVSLLRTNQVNTSIPIFFHHMTNNVDKGILQTLYLYVILV